LDSLPTRPVISKRVLDDCHKSSDLVERVTTLSNTCLIDNDKVGESETNY